MIPYKTEKIQVDGYHVIKEFLLTRGEQIVSSDMRILFKPLIDFGLILYNQKINATNRRAMQYDLEKFFMQHCAGEITESWGGKKVRVPEKLYDEVKKLNDHFRAMKKPNDYESE